MPPFNSYRRRYYKRPQWRWRRRRWTRRWRTRPLIRRGYTRRRRVRRRKFLRYKRKKLKTITIKQWQPDNIRKCKIKGQLCLLTCGQNRINNNFILTAESIIPVGEPGGGGFSIMQLTLRALYDEYVHFRNWWTTSNCGLPLVKYSGCSIKFYCSNDTDYIVTAQHTGPFEVTVDSYLNTQPSRHIMNKKSFVVPKLNPNKKKRPYIKKKFPPPALFYNKWYFQQDILNTPLILLYISATSFDQMYAPNDQISTNITFYSLNTDLFQNPYWEKDDNQPYYPKVVGTQNTGLYTSDQQFQNNITFSKLYPLLNTTQYKIPPHQQANFTDLQNYNNPQNWYNPFTITAHDDHLETPIYYGIHPINDSQLTGTSHPKPSILPITGLYQECRYNPFKDKGIGNIFYVKCTKKPEGSFTTLPTDNRLILRDFPIWLATWGWTSWLEKSKPVYHLHEDYQIVIQSDYIQPKLRCYVPLDMYFTHNDGKNLTQTDKAHWHPKFAFQTETLSKLAETGPATPKINKQKQIQIHALYNFYFKWGGCPAPMETICDPSTQEKFPTPYNIIQELNVENPETPKETYIYKFDERDGYLTKTATKRLKQDIETTKYFTEHGSKDPQLQIYPPTDQTQKETEETTPKKKKLLEQLDLLRDHQQQLQRRIDRLSKRQKLFPIL
uniref:Capsid protein n=1 Tax=Betatorquevirus homini1 TaxID=3048395 RepID=A0AAU8H4R8_9VIRU